MSEPLGVLITEYGMMSPRMRKALETFSGLSEHDQEYNNRTVYVIVHLNDAIVGVARLIGKFKETDRLPIEYGIVEAIESGSEVPAILKVGKLLQIDPSVFPVCEIGGLRVSGSLGMRLRCRVLDLIMKTCHAESHKRKEFSCFFLTGIDAPHMKKLYTDKVFFNEFARVRYGREIWKAFWRTPFTDDFLRDCFQHKLDQIPKSAYKALPVRFEKNHHGEEELYD